ncbi:hypothetical protein O6H91_11G011400 [Diphasiastrum complanatum]|uniref:Uncharacterized protein n=1 Tax=Diphasiastrum complanatum TaxID=34168 RepID=A0ACC2C6D9_DIPCM|nr:hypothetical protein O6H91_11G011400 [Diphasiastrum complanatum]
MHHLGICNECPSTLTLIVSLVSAFMIFGPIGVTTNVCACHQKHRRFFFGALSPIGKASLCFRRSIALGFQIRFLHVLPSFENEEEVCLEPQQEQQLLHLMLVVQKLRKGSGKLLQQLCCNICMLGNKSQLRMHNPYAIMHPQPLTTSFIRQKHPARTMVVVLWSTL